MRETNNNDTIHEDEIDLKELLHIILEKKLLIIIFTLITTLLSIIYVLRLNPTPIYEGNIMIEIGEVKTDNPNQVYFDNVYNLKEVLEKKFLINVDIPKRTNKILIIKSKNISKDEIKKTLNKAKRFIINRHNEKAKFFDEYIITSQIDGIKIDNEPINKPKKKFIVAVTFGTSIILSIIIIFFLNFVSQTRSRITK